MDEIKRFSYEKGGNTEPADESIVYDTSIPERTESAEREQEYKNQESGRAAHTKKEPSPKNNKEKKSNEMTKSKKGDAKKNGIVVKTVAAVLAAAVVFSALFVFGIILVPAGNPGGNVYSVDDAETLVKYLQHPALQSGDTINITADMTVDISESFGGYAVLPLVNYQCGGNTLTYTNGTVVFVGGSSSADMSGVDAGDCKVFVESPATALNWSGYSDESGINVRTLNGTAHKQDTGITLAGTAMKVPVTVTNISDSAVSNVTVKFTSPNFIFTADDSYTVRSLDAGASIQVELPIIAAYGGHSRITGYGTASDGTLVLKAQSEYIDVAGDGYYAGDIDTNITELSTVQDAVKFGYNNGMSFIVSTKVDSLAEDLSESEIAAIVGSENSFIQIGAYEGEQITHEPCSDCYRDSSFTEAYIDKSKYHVISLGTDVIPNMELNTIQYHVTRTYQDVVNDVIKSGGTVVMPFFFGEETDITRSISMSKTLFNVSAMEVLIPDYDILNSMNTKVALNVWKLYSTFGKEKMFAAAASNNTLPEEVGTYFIKGHMNGLSENSIYSLIDSGNYFFSNGPELAFTMGGAQMGQDFTTVEGATTTAKLYATDDNAITSVRLTKYPVTGDKNEIPSEVVYEEDLTGTGTYIFSKELTLTVNPDEYYVFEVFTESSKLGTDVGFASSNPIYAVASEKADAKVAGTAITDINYLLGGNVEMADNGSYFLTTRNYISALLSVSSKGNDVTVYRHILNNPDICDYLIVSVKADDGTTSTQKVFIKK